VQVEHSPEQLNYRADPNLLFFHNLMHQPVQSIMGATDRRAW
jgi:hypothetical protein